MTEDQLEQESLAWLAETGYSHYYGLDIAPDGPTPERSNYSQVLLVGRLREAIDRLNPFVPPVARIDALQQVLNLDTPVLLAANRAFHQLLVNGVSVEYQKDGETRGDFVRLIDFADVAANEWLAVNQYSIKGTKHTRRPDIILFVNGLPLVLLELKNPADEKADIWKAYDQIQTYKEQIPDLFQYNELLVISDGTEARLGSLSANVERFMAWRTIDGLKLDPLGQFNELETLIRGVLAPAFLLDFLRFFVLFEDDGTLVKKIAGYHQFHAVRSAIEQVIAASRPGGNQKGGVVWHTQGSGKSITMTCFAARVMRESAMENPTIVVITDRNDLDGQLFGVFSLSQELLREQPMQGETRQDLRAKLDIPAERNRSENAPVDSIAIDSIYTPIRKVNFSVSKSSDGQLTDSDRLTLEVWTDGSVTPEDAVAYAAKIIKEQLTIFVNFDEDYVPSIDEDIQEANTDFDEYLYRKVTDFELSVRSGNALKNAGIKVIGELVIKSESEMLKTKNFGRSSLTEMKDILAEMGLSFGMKIPNFPNLELMDQMDDEAADDEE